MSADWKLLLRPSLLTLAASINKRLLISRIPLALIVAIFWAGFYLLPFKVFSYLKAAGPIGDVIAERMIGMMFFGLMGFVTMSATITAISSIYLARDLSFLRSMPIDDAQILGSKSFRTVIGATWMMLAFMPPVIAAAGVTYAAGAEFYAVASILFLMFILICAGVGIMLAHLLVRMLPARGARNMLALLGIVMFVAVYFVLKRSAPGGADDPMVVFDAMTSMRAEHPMLPSYWITHSVVDMLRGGHASALHAFALASSALFALVAAMGLGSIFFQANIERMRPARESYSWGHTPPRASRAVFYKDIRLFARDTAQWSQAVIIFSLVIVYVHNFASVPIASISALLPHARELFVLLNLLMAGMVLAAVGGRFLYTAISLEGQAFWVLRAAPVKLSRILRQKLLFGALPIAALMIVMVASSNIAIGVTGGMAWVSVALAALMAVSVGGLGVGLGAMRPVFAYDSITSVAVGFGAVVFMFLAMLLVVLNIALVALPYYLYIASGSVSPLIVALCALCVLGLNAVAYILPMRLGLRKLEQLAH